MFKTQEIRPLSDFVRNTSRHMDRLRETRRPELLTLNGAPELVVQNAQAYEEMLERLEELETVAALNEAAAEIERGEGRPTSEVPEHLRRELGVRQRVG